MVLGPLGVPAVRALGLISVDTEPNIPPMKTRPCTVITVSPASWALRGSGKVKYRRGLRKNNAETQGLGFLSMFASSAGSGNTVWAPSSPAGGFGLSSPRFLIYKMGWLCSQVRALTPWGPSQRGVPLCPKEPRMQPLWGCRDPDPLMLLSLRHVSVLMAPSPGGPQTGGLGHCPITPNAPAPAPSSAANFPLPPLLQKRVLLVVLAASLAGLQGVPFHWNVPPDPSQDNATRSCPCPLSPKTCTHSTETGSRHTVRSTRDVG